MTENPLFTTIEPIAFPAPAAATPRVGEKITIVIAEDDENIRDTMLAIFKMKLKKAGIEEENCQFTICHDGQDALNKIAEMTKAPDILITDGKMPRKTGEDLIGELRGDPKYNDMAILAMSGGTHNGVYTSMEKNRTITAFFEKPDQLIALVNKAVELVSAKVLQGAQYR